MKTLTILLLLLLCLGCDYNTDRRKAFGEPRMLTDSTGGVWLVEHSLGDNYELQRIRGLVNCNGIYELESQ
jgi:hypothetical protein